MSGPEAFILRDVLAAWGNHPRLRIWRTNTGRAQMNGRWVVFNPPGTPDVSGILTVGGIGVALGVEVKSAVGRQRPEQATFQRIYEQFGALYILARTVSDVDSAILAFTARLGDPCRRT